MQLLMKVADIILVTVIVPALAGAAQSPPDVAALLQRIKELEHTQQDILQHLNLKSDASLKVDTKPEAQPQPNSTSKHKHRTDMLNNLSKRVKAWCNEHFMPIIAHPWTCILGIVLWLQWHVRFHFSKCIDRIPNVNAKKHKPFLWSKRLGLNVIIFNFYYGTYMPSCITDRKFVCAMYLVFFDFVMNFILRVITTYCCRRDEACFYTKEDGEQTYSFVDVSPIRLNDAELENPVDHNEDDGVDYARPGAESKYEDLSCKFNIVVALFWVQGSLFLFYVNEMNFGENADDMKDSKKVDVNFWFVAVIMQMFIGEAQLGQPFSQKYWRRIIFTPVDEVKNDDQENSINKSLRSIGNMEWFVRGSKIWHQWLLRAMMDFTINGVLRSIVMYTFPMMLGVEGPLDFVKDCTALLFITDLDNSEEIYLMKIAIRLKFLYWHEKHRDNVEAREQEHRTISNSFTENLVADFKNAEAEFLLDAEELKYIENESYDDIKVKENDKVWIAFKKTSRKRVDPPAIPDYLNP